MRDLLKHLGRFFSGYKEWTPWQKTFVVAVPLVFIVAIVILLLVSTGPERISVFTQVISDQSTLDNITLKLDEENIQYEVDSSGKLYVADVRTARLARNILIREDLLPQGTDPWEIFDVTRWTQTDFERNVNLRRAITRQIEQHVKSLDDVDNAVVTLVLPEDVLFTSEQEPVSASVILSIKPGSDLRENRKKLEGIEKLILFAVEGLSKEHLTIADSAGIQLNDFQGLEDFDRLEVTKREFKIKRDVESQYTKAIKASLGAIFSEDRVRVVNINVDLILGVRTEETTENYPIVVRPDDPNTPFDESERVLSIPRSSEDISENYEGTGFNPEGPPGVEGQVPPSYKDLDGIVGSWNSSQQRINNEINQKKLYEEKSPEIKRVTASIAIDGIWRWNYDEKGNLVIDKSGSIERSYVGLTDEEIRKALSLVEDAVGHDNRRGDSVTVQNIQFDRTVQFAMEDEEIRKQMRNRFLWMMFWIALGLALFILILIRWVVRIAEARQRLLEDSMATDYQAMREDVVQDYNEDEEDQALVTQSKDFGVENFIQEARDRLQHDPESVVQLIRIWMKES